MVVKSSGIVTKPEGRRLGDGCDVEGRKVTEWMML
jgi:hypothetical protein